MTAYRFHSDPGHGWLAVKRAELVRLGLDTKVSTYSYERGKTVYLEEDCDASLFIVEKRRLGETTTFIVSNTDKRSPIRSYDCYRRRVTA